jgi:hypothetical protein
MTDELNRPRILYPVDQTKVNMETTLEEQEYDIDMEKQILAGVIHPRFIRWFTEDSNNPEPVNDPQILKRRYRTCKLCPEFDQETKMCDKKETYKHIPHRVQFKNETCPLNKWND